MATVVSEPIDWTAHSSRARYPWDEWTNGEAYQAVEGEDFSSKPGNFAAMLRVRAKTIEMDVKVLVKREKDEPAVVFFQFV